MAADINMYGLKYQFSRTSTNGADILITIHKKWYEGEVITRALGRAPVIKRENKDHIYGTSCELYLECKVDGEFAEMYTSDPYEYRVAVYKNSTLLWMGYVSPELYSEPDVDPPYDVQVIATDGLGELKNFDFGKRGTASILSHINYLMSKSGIGVPLNIVSDLRYTDTAGATSAAKDILNVKVNLDHDANSSCYEALQSLLSSLNANITQINGSYLIFRETDFIVKAQETGVEAFDVNGNSLKLPVAKFGSMRTHQWWPVGQLSSVIEPAKNKLTLKAPDHYKDNVLDFESWSLIDASYLDNEGAYSLPNKNSAITQALDFGGQEVGYRLGLRVRARNVGAGQYGGTSDKAQNLGLKVEMEGRAFADYLGPKFWLIKSEGISSGYALSDYMWKSNEESSVEEELRNPSSADSAADAQNIDIVLPLFDDGTNMYGSYAYAKKIKITIFNPAGEHGIYVYDVSLVKYEQIKGYQADVVIDNAARESGSSIDLTLSSGVYAPSAADVFMTGVTLQPSGDDIISQWMVGGDQMREYLTAMSFDYSRAVALPKMKYTGVLNVPGSETLLPTLFLRDGTFYFPKTYTYDLYADELNVELISISAADVSLSYVVISQTSEASATMGATTGSVGGGGIVSMPRDKEMSDTSDNAVENKVIKAYIDALRDQLLDLWHLDENGNLVTDKQVLIKNNLIVEQDTSSGGEGEDTPSGGISGVKVNGVTYYDDNGDGVIDLGTISGGGGTADLSNYYTKAQSDARYLALSGGVMTGDIATKSFWSGTDNLGVYVEGLSHAGLRFQYQKENGNYDQLLMQDGVLKFNSTQVALVTSNITGHASSATKLYASDAGYAFDSANPYYLKMRYNVLGDNSWYLSVYPETPLSVSVDKAQRLVTPRSIWGQSFDGAGDVLAGSGVGLMSSKGYYYGLSILPVGNPYWGVRTFLTYDEGSTMASYEITSRNYYGLLISHAGGVAYDFGNIPSNLSYTDLINIRPNGNVGVGTVELYDANKLRLVNTHHHQHTWSLGSLANESDFSVEFRDPVNTSHIYGLYTSINFYTGSVAMQVGRSDGLTNAYGLMLQPLGGNVLIGTDIDSGYKLDVNGDSRINGNLIVSGDVASA